LIVLLLIVLIAETSVVMTQRISSAIQSISYGTFSYGCRDLQASPASNGATINDTTVRWEQFTCPKGHALRVAPASFDCHDFGWVRCATMTPTFIPPHGLLGIYAVGDLIDSCPGPNPSLPLKGPPLISGVPIHYGYTVMDYCAVVSRAVGSIDPFSIEWSTGPYRPYVIPSVGMSAPSMTVARGQNATFTLTLTSLRGFEGNVSFTRIGSVQPYMLYGGVYIKPSSVIVPAGGSKSTTVTIQIPTTQPPAQYTIPVYGDAEYGLQFYGDYSGSPTREGNSTNIQLTIT
jgi:hypothetical protein